MKAKTQALADRDAAKLKRSIDEREAKPFLAWYPGSTVEVIEPENVWDFAGVPAKGR